MRAKGCAEVIALWDPATFDLELNDCIQSHSRTIRDYRQFSIDRSAKHRDRWAPQPENPYGDAFEKATQHLTDLMRDRTIRAFHYSRMTDREVGIVRRIGFQPTSLALLRARLDGQVHEGNLRPEEADAIYACSPLQSQAFGNRLDMFWMTTTPVPVLDGAVELLLGSWGGEAAYWCVDQEMERRLQGIGRGRVFEIDVPLHLARDIAPYAAAGIVIDLHAQTLGFPAERSRMDLYVQSPLPAEAIIAVKSEGEEGYASFGMRGNI